jgi:hypothetical protein
LPFSLSFISYFRPCSFVSYFPFFLPSTSFFP